MEEPTRRTLLGAIAVGATAGGFLGPVRSYLSRFAPGSGGVWQAARSDPPSRVDSEYGSATLRYDATGVPRIEADTEAGLYFAVGYAQAADRLFQMDLQRRQMRGRLSEVVGTPTLASDRFHLKMDFTGAAAATVDALEDTDALRLVAAYCDGANRARDQLPLPVEFQLLEYEPDPWRPVDVALAEKQIAWGLTGNFRTLRRETLASELDADAAETLMPSRLAHDATILGHDGATDEWHPSPEAGAATVTREVSDRSPEGGIHPGLYRWLSAFESPPWAGSNSWAVGGAYTSDGSPILANDPHLLLQAPPVWYEQVLSAPNYRVRGVTFPGVPFVVIGETDTGAWSFTNAGTDVVDFYEYETRNGGREYRYGDEWREFETRTTQLPVAGETDREVTVRKTVHGPVIGREADGDELRSMIGVAWTGFAATRTTVAIHEMARSDGIDEFEAALRDFDEPTQNCVYTARDGGILYRVTGRIPIRRTDGDPVSGTQVFDGSAREGEWEGYTPFGDSSWEGFIPFDEMPHLRDPEYIGTANQRIVDDDAYPYYLAAAYGAPFRGIRLWDRLDELVARGNVSASDLEQLQRDHYDVRADLFVPVLQAERERFDDPLRQAIDRLSNWDRRMSRDSRAALIFARFLAHYRDVAVRPVLDQALDDRRDVSEYLPNDWVLAGLSPDSRWFPEGRTEAVRQALDQAIQEIEAADWEVYGDYNRTTITHPFDQPWLNYPAFPTDGSEATLFNVHPDAAWGSSWRQVCHMGGESRCILPGGNDGSPFSPHFHDQLRRWANGEYKSMDRDIRGDIAVRFTGDGQ